MNEQQKHQQEIYDLQTMLTSSNSDIGDYKIIKCYEASLSGAEMPYDLEDLLAKSQAARDRINELQRMVDAEHDKEKPSANAGGKME